MNIHLKSEKNSVRVRAEEYHKLKNEGYFVRLAIGQRIRHEETLEVERMPCRLDSFLFNNRKTIFSQFTILTDGFKSNGFHGQYTDSIFY